MIEASRVKKQWIGMKIRYDFMGLLSPLPVHEKRITSATCLTLLRVVLSPVLVALMFNGYWYASFWCFMVAALSDMADGMVARIYNQQTVLGAYLDPIADKIMMVSCFFTLTLIDAPFFTVPWWFAWLVLIKEGLLVLGIMLFYRRYGYLEIRPTLLSKIGTLIQFCFIGFFFFCYFFPSLGCGIYRDIYNLLFGVVVVMVLGSLVQYASIGLQLKKKV